MGDDIDDLLDEVEAKFVRKSKSGKANSNTTRKMVTGSVQTTTSAAKHVIEESNESCKKNFSTTRGTGSMDELSDLINDICEMPAPPDDFNGQREGIPNNVPQGDRKGPQGDRKTRCFPVFIGGTSLSHGLSTTANHRACNQLRCTDCDFKVSVFDGYSWEPKTDYLFLRNNIPDFSRLKSNLKPNSGWRAYACQCKWQNVSKVTDLNSIRQVKWVCGKH